MKTAKRVLSTAEERTEIQSKNSANFVPLCLRISAACANFLDDHRYASDFIEGIRSHHEDAKSTKLKDRKIFLEAGFKPA